MKDVDLSASTRLPFQMELLTASSRMKDPAALLRLFVAGLRNLYGHRPALVLSTHRLNPGDYAVGLRVGEDGADQVRARDPWGGEGLPIHHGGLLGDIIARPGPRLIHDLDLSADPVLARDFAGHHSLAAVPIFEGGAAHNWLVLFDRRPDAFSVPDLEELNLRANLVGAVINHLRVARQLHDAHVYIQREVERIASIQRSLLPAELPPVPGLRMAASYATFDRAGGDLYDVRPARLAPSGEPDLWSLLIADASGHGPSAAVMTAVLDALLRAYAADPPGPGDMLGYANRMLCGKKIGDSFVTAFLGFYEPATRELTYACAGHNPPLARGGGGGLHYLDRAGGLPLGIECAVGYDTATVRFEPGHTLLLYTDGICEAMNPLNELLGMDQIESLVAKWQGDPDGLIRALLSTLRTHECGRRPCDDQTLLAIQVV